MDPALKQQILSILAEGQDLTLATLREDGSPQATTVSYASDGLAIYFGCAAESQKARNLDRDGRFAATVDLPYSDWSHIRGLNFGGRAKRVSDPDELMKMARLFMGKFPQIAAYLQDPGEAAAFFRLTPEVVSVLDYTKGFGHTELAQAEALAGAPAREPAEA